MEPMVLVFRSGLLVQAHMAHNLLEGLGIPSELRGAHRSGLGGMIPMQDSEAEVWVARSRTADALEALGLDRPAVADGRLSIAAPGEGGELALADGGELSEPGGPAPSEPEACAACGAAWEPGFEVCWNCDASR